MKPINFIIAIVLAALAFAAHAAGTATGTVVTNTGNIAGEVYLTSSGTPSGTPGCASANPGRWGVNATTAGGAATLREINMAIITGRTIVLTGSGACTVTGNIEDLGSYSITW